MKDNKNIQELILWSIILVIVIMITVVGRKWLNAKETEEDKNKESSVKQVVQKESDEDINQYLDGQTLEEIQKELDEEHLLYENDEGVD